MSVIDDIWSQFLDITRQEAGSRVVETWFKAVTLKRWDITYQTVYLVAPNTFIKNWLSNNYLSLFQLHLGRLLNMQSPKIVFEDSYIDTKSASVENEKKSRIQAASVVPIEACFDENVSKSIIVSKQETRRSAAIVNTAYRFDTFIVGPSNSLAYAAAHAVTQKPGILYNPLFIHGGSGLGKTHLLHAIGNNISQINQNMAVLYQPAERFTDDFITAVRSNGMHRFNKKYQSADVLLIDDIQVISRKEQTQEAFYNIFNNFYNAGKQIVFSGDTLPGEMDGLGMRLRSRLVSGLVADISGPSLETKIAILQKKAALSGKSLPDEVAYFIAASPSFYSVRDLEGALVRIIALSALTNQLISLDLARSVLLQGVKKQSQMVSLERIVKIVSNFYPCSFSELRSKVRTKNLVIARHLVIYFMKKLMQKSLRDIGAILGDRNHATILHALEKIETARKQDLELQSKISLIETAILGNDITHCS